jgi:hypothetical protein
MDLGLRSSASYFVLEIRKCAITLRNEKQRFKTRSLFANVENQAHQVRLWWQIADPDSMT